MKTADILRHYRNATTPAARLARWQSRPAPRRLAELRAAPSYRGDTIAARRRYYLDHLDPGPELSAPDAESPYLWTTEDSPLVLNCWPGRDFLRHRGWYTMDEGTDGETLEAYAVQLADFPGLIFEAIQDSMSDSLRVNLDDWHAIDYSQSENSYDAADAIRKTVRDAIRSADSTAEHEAEKERDYQREEDRKRQAEEARADLKTNRAQVRALIADLRRLCPTSLPGDYPAAASAVRAQLAALLRDRRDTLDRIQTLTA